MATILVPGDIAIIHYNSTGADAFSFVFLHAVEAGTSINFTDQGWQAAGGFRPGEGTVTYTAPTAIVAGTIVTPTGLDLDDAGDQIIAYQGSEASPTILYVVDLAWRLSIRVNVAAFSRSSASSSMVEVRFRSNGITDADRPIRFSRGPRAESGRPSGRSPKLGISAIPPAAGCRPGWCQSERLRREPPALRPPP